MKIVRIIGGLGNQMFQYALYVALKYKFPEERVVVDTSCFRVRGSQRPGAGDCVRDDTTAGPVQ